MKIIAMISAALIGSAAILLPTGATAGTGAGTGAGIGVGVGSGAGVGQGQRTERTVVVQRSRVVRQNNGWRNNRTRRVCKVTYRNGNRIRRCRTVRVRY